MAYPTGPGPPAHRVVGACQHQPALAYGGYPPPPPPAYGGEYTYPPAPAYGGGYLAFVPAPYGPYLPYTAPAAQPKSPVISGTVAAGIEALAIGVFRGAITDTWFGDGGNQ